jgi:hypothetical protein
MIIDVDGHAFNTQEAVTMYKLYGTHRLVQLIDGFSLGILELRPHDYSYTVYEFEHNDRPENLLFQFAMSALVAGGKLPDLGIME